MLWESAHFGLYRNEKAYQYDLGILIATVRNKGEEGKWYADVEGAKRYHREFSQLEDAQKWCEGLTERQLTAALKKFRGEA